MIDCSEFNNIYWKIAGNIDHIKFDVLFVNGFWRGTNGERLIRPVIRSRLRFEKCKQLIEALEDDII